MNLSSIRELNEQVQEESTFLNELIEEIRKVVVGQDALIERVLIGLLADGHILLEGVPGLAKTLLIKTVSQAISSDFSRLQFTPDLLPADLIGTQIYNPRTTEFTDPTTHAPPSSLSTRGPSSPTSFWPTRSTERQLKCKARYSRPCRKDR